MVGQPLQAFGVATNHQQDWTDLVCHRNQAAKGHPD
jgi:hypothetical protein